MSRENVELIRRAHEALDRGLNEALATIDEIADPEIEWRAVGHLPDTGRVRGPEAVKAYFHQLYSTFDFQVEAEEFIDAGDAVVVVTRQTARGRNSGAQVTDPLVTVWGVRSGKVTYFDAYRDERQSARGRRTGGRRPGELSLKPHTADRRGMPESLTVPATSSENRCR